ncbi:hypothetical protein [Winogradskyella luteola]|uniref:Acetyltransferase n=1 Tax=Winogradskyella luteola TaxID=2828330 RepID=A0A9X1F7G8_9FLAO|nr:hypothetical protein [Winogradskyella luteola]MBV7268634.1 hypothetical protein [Winogradskyella luteola]
MKPDQHTTFQLLGFDPYWVCVVYDLIHYQYKLPIRVEVFPNLELDGKANDLIKRIDYTIKSMQDVRPNQHVLFGLASGRHKHKVYKDFKPYLNNEDYNNLVSNSSVISQSCQLDYGILVDYQCVVSSQTAIGFGVSIKRGAKIGHHNKIGAFTDINPGVVTSGNVTIGKGCEIGTGSLVNNNVTIGDNTFIGMGSVVTKDIPPNCIAYGSPCKVVRPNELWEI